MIEFVCPNCNEYITVPDKAAGRAGVCPKCRSRVVVPGAAAAPASATGGASPAASPAPGGAQPEPSLRLMPEDDPPAPEAPRPQAPASQPAPAASTEAPAAPRKPCPYCGEMVAATAKKCRFCGESLTKADPAPTLVACPFCAEMIPVGSRRCQYCGETLGAAPAPASAPARPASAGNTGRHVAVKGDTGRHGAVSGDTGRNAAVRGDTGRHRAVKGNTDRHKTVAQPRRPAPSRVNIGGIVALLVALLVVGVIVKGWLLSSSPNRQVRELRDQAEQGDAEAQYALGGIYQRGTVVEKDLSESVRWFRKAAEQGHTEAQNCLGVCYSDGLGVRENLREAVKWFRKAAAQDNREAQYNLAMHYLAGTGVRQDVAEARRLLRKSADQGYAMAHSALQDLGPDDDEDDEEKTAKAPPRPASSAPRPAMPPPVPPAPRPRNVAGLTFEPNFATVELPGKVKLAMVEIAPGAFWMGSPASEEGRDDDETRHRVTLSRKYWLGKYEVTQGQWKAVMGNNPSHAQKGDDYPVEQVSWRDAMAFCEKLNERFRGGLPHGYRFYLPTEAQWEYAARGGKISRDCQYSGSNDAGIVAWCYENSGDKRLDITDWKDVNAAAARATLAECGTHPVGRKMANELGLCDMSGNVAEWCRDRYGVYRSGETLDPAGPMTGEARVARGGSWLTPSLICCRAASRDSYDPDDQDNPCLGFRLALVAVE